jgi:hypothetical protein
MPNINQKYLESIVNTIILAICLCTVYIFGSFSRESNWWRTTLGLVTGVLTTIVGAILIDQFRILLKRWFEGQERRRFADLFEIAGPEADVAIVLSKFTSSNSGSDDDSTNNDFDQLFASRSGRARKSISEANRKHVALADLVAARSIASMFAKAGFKQPWIEFDEDMFGEIFHIRGTYTHREERNLRPEYSAYIIVGLFSNHIAAEVNCCREGKFGRLFRFSSFNQLSINEKRGIAIATNKSSDNLHTFRHSDLSTWDVELDGGLAMQDDKKPTRDFALIAKARTLEQRPLFIVGGTRSRGTRKAAAYLADHWSKIQSEQRRQTPRGSAVAFAGIYDCPAGSKKPAVEFRLSFDSWTRV